MAPIQFLKAPIWKNSFGISVDFDVSNISYRINIYDYSVGYPVRGKAYYCKVYGEFYFMVKVISLHRQGGKYKSF